MNNLRPQISYAELLAAAQHARLIKFELQQELNFNEKISNKEIKLIKENFMNTQTLINNIDKIFLKQAFGLQVGDVLDLSYALNSP